MDHSDVMPQASAAVRRVLEAAAETDPATPAPCREWTLRALADHFAGTSAALATLGEGGELDADDPWGAGTHTGYDWAATVAANLDRLGAAWSAPTAWEGEYEVGGQSMPAPMAGQMTLVEVVAHGWDVATAAGVALELPDDVTAAFRSCAGQTAELGRQMGAYGAAPETPADADDLTRGLAATGRSRT